MTAPLTPADCDLQDFPFMPLHVARLRDSDLAAEADPEACWYAVLLWAAAWHQIPAASLPDNDAILTKLIGLGRDVKTFRKHRAGAMRGFVACADGRLYHAVVAEQACAAWEGKLQQRWRTECARVKKANQRTGADAPLPTYEAFIETLAPTSRPLKVTAGDDDCPPGPAVTSPGTETPCPSGNTIQGTEKGKGTGTGIQRELTLSVIDGPSPIREADFEIWWALYPKKVGKIAASKAYDKARRGKAKPGAETLLGAVKRAQWPAEARFIPNPATWLNEGRWMDSALPLDLAQPKRVGFV